VKTVLTRVGEGSKIVLTGDIEQIDNVYIDAKTNGLSYVIEKMKEQNISGHVTLMKGERSKVATIAAQLL
jgi:PhoH-like ATPase